MKLVVRCRHGEWEVLVSQDAEIVEIEACYRRVKVDNHTKVKILEYRGPDRS